MTDGLQLEGKVCVVTGASSGIGEATALRLSEAGAAVVLAARRRDRLESLAERIRSNGGRALPIEVDITDEQQARELIDRATADLGRLDILVNNAGVMLLGLVYEADTEEWRRMVDLNVMGLLYCTHAALPIMRDQGSGHIVNISSVAGRVARAGSAVYNATKWAVGAFSEALRQEVLHINVRVTIIEPGMVVTELADHISQPIAIEAVRKMRESMNAPLEADDIADTILYAVTRPQHVSVNEMLVRPTEQDR
jgi:NADP-dependent 3-hydroxy acid dehydrogenase YdfG